MILQKITAGKASLFIVQYKIYFRNASPPIPLNLSIIFNVQQKPPTASLLYSNFQCVICLLSYKVLKVSEMMDLKIFQMTMFS